MAAEPILQDLAESMSDQERLLAQIALQLQQLEIGGGGGPSGPIHASDVIYDNTESGTEHTNIQDTTDEIYTKIGNINTILEDIL